MKKIVVVFGLVVVCLVMAAILLVTMVDPNRFKPLITEAVKQQTGLHVVIQGNLSWSLLPNPGVKIEHMTVSHSSESEKAPLAEIDGVTVSMKLFPPFHSVMRIDQVKFSHIHMSNVKIKTHFEKGILDLDPITANFYQGILQGKTSIDFNGAEPRFIIQAKLMDVQMEPLLADTATHAQLSFSGAGRVDLAVTTRGKTGPNLIKHLNGSSTLSFNKGTLIGIDLPYWVNTAYALAQNKDLIETNTKKTEFTTCSASAVIKEGVILNNDLQLTSAVTHTQGKGSINLTNQQISYQLNNLLTQTENKKNNLFNLYGVAVPVLITGSLNSPSIKLDTQDLVKAVGKKEIEKVKDKIKDIISSDQGQKMLNSLFGH